MIESEFEKSIGMKKSVIPCFFSLISQKEHMGIEYVLTAVSLNVGVFGCST
jgi:hypothetical protein